MCPSSWLPRHIRERQKKCKKNAGAPLRPLSFASPVGSPCTYTSPSPFFIAVTILHFTPAPLVWFPQCVVARVVRVVVVVVAIHPSVVLRPRHGGRWEGGGSGEVAAVPVLAMIDGNLFRKVM